MAIFRYNGDKEKMNGVFGYDFSDHKEVEIPDNETRIVEKLTNNSHFDLVSDSVDDPDINCDFGVFRVKEDGQNYSKPDRSFDSMEQAEAFILEQDDEKERTILKRTKA